MREGRKKNSAPAILNLNIFDALKGSPYPLGVAPASLCSASTSLQRFQQEPCGIPLMSTPVTWNVVKCVYLHAALPQRSVYAIIRAL